MTNAQHTTGFYGYWTGEYHWGTQIVSIHQCGFLLKAVKRAGNDLIPVGALAWQVDLRKIRASGSLYGIGVYAPKGMLTLKLYPIQLVVINRDTIRIDIASPGARILFHRQAGPAEVMANLRIAPYDPNENYEE